MSLPYTFTWNDALLTGNLVPATGTVDTTNFPGLGFAPVPPAIFGPIPPGSIVPRFPVSPGKIYLGEVVEPDIPMAPPTNRRRIKLIGPGIDAAFGITSTPKDEQDLDQMLLLRESYQRQFGLSATVEFTGDIPVQQPTGKRRIKLRD